MAKDKKTPEVKAVEKEYVIPLRKEWRKVANYRRTGRAVREIKKFIAKHMKVPDRDVEKVKLDIYLNQEVWFRGKRKPPAKIKVKAVKEGDLVRVTLADVPDYVKFLKAKHAKKHLPSAAPKTLAKPEVKKEEQTEGEKKEEKEKATSSAVQKEAQAKTQAKVLKQATNAKEVPIHRKALKK